jgi:hypothetical protein
LVRVDCWRELQRQWPVAATQPNSDSPRAVYGLAAASNVATFTYIAPRRIIVFLREKLQKSEEEKKKKI